MNIFLYDIHGKVSHRVPSLPVSVTEPRPVGWGPYPRAGRDLLDTHTGEGGVHRRDRAARRTGKPRNKIGKHGPKLAGLSSKVLPDITGASANVHLDYLSDLNLERTDIKIKPGLDTMTSIITKSRTDLGFVSKERGTEDRGTRGEGAGPARRVGRIVLVEPGEGVPGMDGGMYRTQTPGLSASARLASPRALKDVLTSAENLVRPQTGPGSLASESRASLSSLAETRHPGVGGNPHIQKGHKDQQEMVSSWSLTRDANHKQPNLVWEEQTLAHISPIPSMTEISRHHDLHHKKKDKRHGEMLYGKHNNMSSKHDVHRHPQLLPPVSRANLIEHPTLAGFNENVKSERSVSLPQASMAQIKIEMTLNDLHHRDAHGVLRQQTLPVKPKIRNISVVSISSEPGHDVIKSIHKQHTYHGSNRPKGHTTEGRRSSRGHAENACAHERESRSPSSQHEEEAPLTSGSPRARLPPALRHTRLNRHLVETGPDPEFMAQFSHIEPLLRFRRIAKTIITLLKATTSSRRDQQRSEAKLLSFSQFKDELLKSSKKTYGTELSFDPETYRAYRELTISNEAKTILSLEPRERTEDQLHVALLSLQQTVDAFGEFPIGMQNSLVRVGWYEHFESKRVIIRQGHTADNFYLILSGTAVVTILETNKAGETYMRTAATLGKGNSFGELALMHGATRSATVTCKDDVELLAVGREDFIDIFMRVEKNKEPEHIQYLRQIEMLNGWPIEKLPYNDPKICLFTYFRRGVVMCRDSNAADWLYIIKTGSCRVLKKLVSTKPNLPGLEKQDYHPVTLVTKAGGVSPRSHRPRCEPNAGGDQVTTPGRGKPQKDDVTLRGIPRHRTEEEVLRVQEEHRKQIEEVFRERHDPLTLAEKERQKTKVTKQRPPPEVVFVLAQKLGPRDTFGFEHVAFGLMDKCTSVSLVSDGAEAVLINKKFFLQHLTDEVRKNLRCTVQPYPSEESMQQKLQDKTNWEAYKTMTVNSQVAQRRTSQDVC